MFPLVTANTISFPPRIIRCHYRPLILTIAALVLVTLFWFTSRYPQLLHKLQHVGQTVPTMAYSSELFPVIAAAPLWQKILYGAGNWLASMRVGMTFGVLLGALLLADMRSFLRLPR